MGERAHLERDGDLGVLVLGDPPLNLFSREMSADILSALDETDGCRALVVRAEGRYFTGGVDVHVFHGMSEEDAHGFAATLLAITHRFEELPFPTLASVHGLCVTAGVEMALACDMIFAAESARFGLVEATVGLSPFMGGTQRMAERAGAARAAEFVMSADLYDARTLAAWGVVNRVLPDDDLAGASLEFGRRLAAGPTRAHHATKRVLRAYGEGGVPGADDAVSAIAAPLFATRDVRNAVETFLREGPGKATFEGR